MAKQHGPAVCDHLLQVNGKPIDGVKSVVIEIPFGADPKECYAARHVDVQLDHRQAVVLKRMFAGLDAVGERLGNNRRIQSGADVVRWMLEKAAE